MGYLRLLPTNNWFTILSGPSIGLRISRAIGPYDGDEDRNSGLLRIREAQETTTDLFTFECSQPNI